MAHMLVTGPTFCGKSTAVRAVIKKAKAAGRKVIVYARRDLDAWRAIADFVTSDRTVLLEVLGRPGTRSCIVIFDDAGATVGHYDPEMEAIANESRHDGHACIFIAQAATMLNKNIRRNCTQLIMFKQAKEDCEILAREFIHPELNLGVGLERYQYLECEKGFGPVTVGRVTL